MRFTSRFRAWSRGWLDLAKRGQIPGYADQGVAGRLRLDAGALGRALRSAGCLGAALACTATGLAAQVLAWELDLRGWRRDGLLCLPALLAAPWVAAARRRHVGELIAARALPDERAVTEGPPPPGHSAPVGTAERGRWRQSFTTVRQRIAGRAWAGSISCWPSRVSACWRRWRCRASAR